MQKQNKKKIEKREIKKTFVLIYGDCRKGMSYHNIITGSKYLGTDMIYGFQLLDVVGRPMALPDDKKHFVSVERYEITDNIKRKLKRYFSYPRIYRIISTLSPNKEDEKYDDETIMFYIDPKLSRHSGRGLHVKNGDWLEHIKQQRLDEKKKKDDKKKELVEEEEKEQEKALE